MNVVNTDNSGNKHSSQSKTDYKQIIHSQHQLSLFEHHKALDKYAGQLDETEHLIGKDR